MYFPLVIFTVCCVPMLGLLLAAAGLTLGFVGRNPHAPVVLGLLGLTLSCFGGANLLKDLRQDPHVTAMSLVPMAAFAVGAVSAGLGAWRARAEKPCGWPGLATSVALLLLAAATVLGCLGGFLLGGARPEAVLRDAERWDEESRREKGQEVGLVKGTLAGLGLGALLAVADLLLHWWLSRGRMSADSSFDAISQALRDLGLQVHVEPGAWRLSRPGSHRELVVSAPREGKVLSLDQLRRMLEERGMLGDDKEQP
jgi:hypothetical protein